jgi:hypothetical protein
LGWVRLDQINLGFVVCPGGELEGVTLEIGCGGQRGERGVEDRPRGETPTWDAPMDGQCPVCGAWSSTARANSL